MHLIIARGKNVPLQLLSGMCSCAYQIKPASYWNTEKKIIKVKPQNARPTLCIRVMLVYKSVLIMNLQLIYGDYSCRARVIITNRNEYHGVFY